MACANMNKSAINIPHQSPDLNLPWSQMKKCWKIYWKLLNQVWLFFYGVVVVKPFARQLKQPFGEMSTSIFNQFTFMTRRAKSRTNEQQVQVFMSLTSVSNISQLKMKEKFVLQLLPHRGNACFFLLKERKRHKMKILKFHRFNQV